MLRMKEIYENAAITIAWVGPAAGNSDQAMHIVKHLGASWCRAQSKGQGMPDLHTSHPMSADLWTCLQRLLHRPYWNRIWILQEASTPSNHGKAFVLCGRQSLPTSWFFDASICLLDFGLREYSPFFESFYNTRIGTLSIWHPERRSKKLGLLSVLPQLRLYDATDPRLWREWTFKKETRMFEIW